MTGETGTDRMVRASIARTSELERRSECYDDMLAVLEEIVAVTKQTFHPTVVGKGVPYEDVKARLGAIHGVASTAITAAKKGTKKSEAEQ